MSQEANIMNRNINVILFILIFGMANLDHLVLCSLIRDHSLDHNLENDRNHRQSQVTFGYDNDLPANRHAEWPIKFNISPTKF